MRRLYLILVCTQALHSTEEIIFGFYRRLPELGVWAKSIIPIYPVISFSVTTFILLNISLITGLFASVLLVYRGVKWAKRLITVVAVIEFFNGAAHMTGVAVTGGYFPGAVTAVALLILGILTLRAALRQSTGA
ncbi:MAG: HXXEE domain-containing protein [candidate division Zixibacteria bacterium]|nr:HXXEE domain-containing protein [candidate division Zixibacteria bacterium]